MVEVELAFILKDRLEGDQVTIFDVLSATDYVVPAVEIIDALPPHRPAHQAPAQGDGHHFRQRRQRRHHPWWPANQADGHRPALGVGTTGTAMA